MLLRTFRRGREFPEIRIRVRFPAAKKSGWGRCIVISDHDGRDRDGRDHDHGLADGRRRDPHDPNVPRAFASLLGSGHNVDDSSMPPFKNGGRSQRPHR
jgi:hypothetical protein